jgi:hypothetical protein
MTSKTTMAILAGLFACAGAGGGADGRAEGRRWRGRHGGKPGRRRSAETRQKKKKVPSTV